MSQHHIRLNSLQADGLVRIQLGWDKPLAHFYMVVFAEEGTPCDDPEGMIYSNLFDEASDQVQDLGYFKAVAHQLGCEIPETIWRAVYQDSEFNAVNKIVYYSAAGEVVEPF